MLSFAQKENRLQIIIRCCAKMDRRNSSLTKEADYFSENRAPRVNSIDALLDDLRVEDDAVADVE